MAFVAVVKENKIKWIDYFFKYILHDDDDDVVRVLTHPCRWNSPMLPHLKSVQVREVHDFNLTYYSFVNARFP